MEIAVQVADLIGGVVSVGLIAGKVRAIAKSRGWGPSKRRSWQPELDEPDESDRAREAVAEMLGVSEDKVSVDDVRNTPWGKLVTCETPFGRFQVEFRDGELGDITKISKATEAR